MEAAAEMIIPAAVQAEDLVQEPRKRPSSSQERSSQAFGARITLLLQEISSTGYTAISTMHTFPEDLLMQRLATGASPSVQATATFTMHAARCSWILLAFPT